MHLGALIPFGMLLVVALLAWMSVRKANRMARVNSDDPTDRVE